MRFKASYQEESKVMRNRQFIALHRGGLLTGEDHQKLMKWARECAMHVIHLTEKKRDHRLLAALEVARQWEEGQAPTGKAMKTSLEVHEALGLSEIDNLVGGTMLQKQKTIKIIRA